MLWLLLAAQDLTLAEGGRSEYRIVLAADAAPAERHAAEELRAFLREMSGAEVPIGTEADPPAPREICLNARARIAALDPGFAKIEPGPDGYAIRAKGPHLLLLGHRPRGTLYGVYDLLEEHLGCRFFTRDVRRVPKRETLRLPPLDLAYAPPFEYRESYWTEAFDGDWAARRRSNGHTPRLEARHGGKIVYFPFVHTFERLLSPDRYFNDHPEYFSEVRGRRLRERPQLCLTNPDVLRIATEGVREWMKSHPEATLFSVSQNDWKNPCTCKACAAVDAREGSPSGSLLEFVNKIAEAVEKDFPGKLVDTLAYQYTRKPPRTVRPRANVRVRLCSIECCFAHPLSTCEKNRAFMDNLAGWAKITDRLYVWDYTTDFSHYLLPFPNLDAIGPNVRTFAEHGVRGLFEQGNYSPGGGGECSELRAYVLARLLWNPKVDVAAEIRDFTGAVYGEAGPLVRQYLELLHDGVRGKDVHLTIRSGPKDAYLGGDFLERAGRILDEAEARVKDAATLARLRKFRLPLEYARLARLPAAERAPLLDAFRSACRSHGITHVAESVPLDQFR